MQTAIEQVPKHIAIILDGNGRWAARHRLPRHRGHLEGVRRVEDIVKMAIRHDIQILTLYAFSTENWRRPRQEINALMRLLCSMLEKKKQMFARHNIRLNFIGERNGIGSDILKTIDRAISATRSNTGLMLNIAFNYGSRQEIVQAIKAMIRDKEAGRLALDRIKEETVNDYLYTHGLPDPDLLIRTSGELRISNFLLWQLSYSELYFTDTCWPDFNQDEFMQALLEYQRRERRYGKVSSSA